MTLLSTWIVTSGIRCLFIIIAAMCTVKILNWKIDKLQQKFSELPTNRFQTLSSILRLSMKLVVTGVAFALILSEVGVDLAPVLATAGVLGLAISFGAKELVQDVISGFFILLEDQLQVGDTVNIDGSTGTVEKVGLKTIVLRDPSGAVHYIRNGRVSKVQNMSKDYSYAVMNIGISYESDYELACSTMKDVAQELMNDETFKENFSGDFDLLGLAEFADSALIIRARFKTQAAKHWMVGREYNKRLKIAFDKAGIDFPYPTRTVYNVQANKI